MADTFVVEEVLTSFARGFMQDMKKSLANFIARLIRGSLANSWIGTSTKTVCRTMTEVDFHVRP